MDIDEVAHAVGIIFCRSALGDFDLAPGTMDVEEDEEIDRAVATILVIVTFEPARLGRNRLTRLADELHRAFVEAHHRPLGIGRFGIEIKHTSSMRATYSPSTFGMHHMSLRQGLRSFSARRRRTVSCDRLLCSVSLTIAPASSSSVQRARPLGGLAQAVATSKASSLPVSLRSAPGRGSSLSARSRLPSTKRRLVRYTVEPPTPTLLAISSSLAPASAARLA
jgi:hypothetical protein